MTAITDEELKEIGERLLGSPEDQGRQLFELLSDDNKRRAIRGELPDNYFSSEKMQALREYIESSGITVDSYFAEVEMMPIQERRVREAVASAGLAYNENASLEDNAQRAHDVVLESINSGRPVTAVAAEYVAQAVEATGIETGTQFRERISVLTEPPAPTQPTDVGEQAEWPDYEKYLQFVQSQAENAIDSIERILASKPGVDPSNVFFKVYLPNRFEIGALNRVEESNPDEELSFPTERWLGYYETIHGLVTSDDPTSQVEGLVEWGNSSTGYDPIAFLSERQPGITTEEYRRAGIDSDVPSGKVISQWNAVSGYEPPAPERRPFEPAFQLPPSERLDTMGPRPELSPEIKSANTRNRILREQREYDAEVERRTRLEEDMAGARVRAQAVTPTGPDALEQARLTARNMRVRGRGNARESFEEGMAALQQRPAETGGERIIPSQRSPADMALEERIDAREDFSGIPSLPVDTSTAASELFARPPGDQALQDLIDTTAETPVTTGSGGRLSAAQIRDANQAQVELLLAEQFGGFSFFLQKHRSDLQVGLTADGQVVAADDPNAASVKNILDVIVDQGITAPTRVLGLLENTEWWQKTDARMREYDVLTADMSEPQKTEYLEPVIDMLRDEAQFLGFQLDAGRVRELAEQITRMGEETDTEYIRGLLTAEEAFNAAEVTASSFASNRDKIVAMSKRYFTPINEADAAQFAQDIYVGTNTTEGVEQYFREMAAAKFPQLQNSLNAGITPEQYFAPYKYEIERMLDRPNVDLYEEFGDVIQYIPDTGTGEARPMTLGEVRKYVRGLDEWQQSSQGTDSARALSFAIGRVFGEVA